MLRLTATYMWTAKPARTGCVLWLKWYSAGLASAERRFELNVGRSFFQENRLCLYWVRELSVEDAEPASTDSSAPNIGKAYFPEMPAPSMRFEPELCRGQPGTLPLEPEDTSRPGWLISPLVGCSESLHLHHPVSETCYTSPLQGSILPYSKVGSLTR